MYIRIGIHIFRSIYLCPTLSVFDRNQCGRQHGSPIRSAVTWPHHSWKTPRPKLWQKLPSNSSHGRRGPPATPLSMSRTAATLNNSRTIHIRPPEWSRCPASLQQVGVELDCIGKVEPRPGCRTSTGRAFVAEEHFSGRHTHDLWSVYEAGQDTRPG